MATRSYQGPPRGSVSVEEYLSTNYEPDCEFVDGAILERNGGEFEHAFLQALLATLFSNQLEAWGVFALTEQRVQVSPTRFLIPDVCVLRVGDPTADIVTHPPLIAIEILSPDDTIRRAAQKISEYVAFGIQHVWVIEPTLRVGYRGTEQGLELVPSGELTVPGTPIQVHVTDLFSKLDQIRSTQKP
jgi:Uma2 family endonuclease